MKHPQVVHTQLGLKVDKISNDMQSMTSSSVLTANGDHVLTSIAHTIQPQPTTLTKTNEQHIRREVTHLVKRALVYHQLVTDKKKGKTTVHTGKLHEQKKCWSDNDYTVCCICSLQHTVQSSSTAGVDQVVL